MSKTQFIFHQNNTRFLQLSINKFRCKKSLDFSCKP